MEFIKFKKMQFKKYNIDHYFLFDGPKPGNYILDTQDIVFDKPQIPPQISELLDVPNKDLNPHMVLKFLKVLKNLDLSKYEFIVRVNLSTFINYPIMNNLISALPKRKVLAGHILGGPDLTNSNSGIPFYLKYIISGTCMIMSVDCAKYLNLFSEDNPLIYLHNDDVVISYILRGYVSEFIDRKMILQEQFTNVVGIGRYSYDYNKIKDVPIVRIKADWDRTQDIIIWKTLLKMVDSISAD